jgi:hypothetical protein
VETLFVKSLQNNCKSKRIVTNNQAKANQTNCEKGFKSRPGACEQKEWDHQHHTFLFIEQQVNGQKFKVICLHGRGYASVSA